MISPLARSPSLYLDPSLSEAPPISDPRRRRPLPLLLLRSSSGRRRRLHALRSPPSSSSPAPLPVAFRDIHEITELRAWLIGSAVGSSEMVLVDEVPFPPEITTTKSLPLLGHGITDIEIHFLQIKFNAVGIYTEKEIVNHLSSWKGKKGAELADDDLFFESVVSAPVEKFFRIVVIKEIKGSQYGVQLESTVRDRLAAVDKYEEEEEEALEKLTEFFQTKYFKKDSVITFHFPATSQTAEISFLTEGKGEAKTKVENANVVEMIQKWYLGGSRAASQTTVKSLAENLGALLLQ